ncbi:LacI family DNA-binding transcriptional regulator [Bradyrhizobium guangzhouense]|uniref:LacI family DNA-binding transcriptional regulator n=2 Tax=Bradyrhizobium TaxID=374 RepID=A0AAE5X7W2_9BRAD|nr:LacI family DNA-binding transcriptional regulator [Bradyrhizobium guangzhouense]QAU50299.1 LacI family transcriptional regulator [Bradyrhizobium guangzhouense]RXH15127.1 LacI family DNA-binding transcriptional regulator [Bradyrhizobium guangzhouense]
MTDSATQPMVRATLEDVARAAGVSLATVDRVVNRREGVRAKTVARVEAAVAKLGYRADVAAARLARGQTFRFAFVLPTGSNSFMTNLSEQVQRTADWLAGQRGFIDILHVDVFDPDVLAGALDDLPPVYQGVAVVALDHPKVRGAIDELTARGVVVVTLVSDAPSSRRLHYVGIDNPAAGRTAATLMGRFLAGREGKVAVIAGSLSLRDHTERQFGFHQILSSEHPNLATLPLMEGRDDSVRTRELTTALLKRHADLRGIYCCGAGNRGIAEALEASGRARDVVWITHELTQHTRRFLVRGTLDAIINQDPGHEARSAARVLLAHCMEEPISPDQERIRIDIFLRDNLP